MPRSPSGPKRIPAAPALPEGARPVGYQWLETEFQLEVLPHHFRSFIAPISARQKIIEDDQLTIVHPKRVTVADHFVDHLEFALKHEGLHLDLLRRLFPKVDSRELVDRIRSKPSGKYLRKAWYLYESLTGQSLPISDLARGNYVELLDPKYYYTSFRWNVKRQRITDNLLGLPEFCGIVRKTDALKHYESLHLEERCREIIAGYPPDKFARALNYLYRKETKSSFEIENERPTMRRSSEFVALLKDAAKSNFLTREALVRIQRTIVDPRFANDGYRDENDEQIYVGATAGIGREIVHFAGPKPEDVTPLMADFLAMAEIVMDSDLHPVIAAAVISYLFVFIHPFSDGNGRIHRFLIHHVLARKGFATDDLIFPVSAVMLNHPTDYDSSLESFSKPLMKHVDFDLDDLGRMTVLNHTESYYRNIDCTRIAEALFRFVEETIERELPGELEFLEKYDRARAGMTDVVDLPDRIADLFIRLCLQNQGHLSKAKNKLKEFSALTPEEIDGLEQAVREAYGTTSEQGT